MFQGKLGEMHARFNRILLCLTGMEEIKVGRGLRRKTKGGVAEGRTCSLAPRNDPRRYIFRCVLYILLSNDAALSIIDRVKTAYPGICRSRRHSAIASERNLSCIIRSGEFRAHQTGRNRKVSAIESSESDRFETRAQATRVQQHSTEFRSGTRCDLTQRELPHCQPTRRPHAH